MLRRVVPLFLLTLCLAASPAISGDTDAWKETLVGEGSADARVKAGIQLALEDPDLFAKGVEEIAGEKREGDAQILADIAVKIKVRHIRLLLVWAASKFKEAGVQAFQSRIDNDHPNESAIALEALGFLGDHASFDRIMELVRNQNELIALQAARAIARVGHGGGDAKQIAQAALEVNNAHVRLHLTWAAQDVAGSTRAAEGLFARFARKPGTMGYRAKEAIAVLEDELCPVEKYKVKLDEVKKFFNPRGGTKAPPIKGSDEYAKQVKSGLAELKKKSPAWYHMICTVVQQFNISGELWRFKFKEGAINLKPADLVKWDVDDLGDDLVAYYLIRYATILFLGRMGDPTEGHRGWEEGFLEAWHYAMEHTRINVSEDPVEFLKGRIEARPW